VFPKGESVAEKIVKADYKDHRDHVINFLDCVKKRDRNTACSIETGSLSAKYAQLGNIAARLSGTSLWYDDKKRTFGSAEADKYLKPVYREPWVFPKV
jgi:hypothetical protein